MMKDVIIPTLGAIKKTSHPYSCFERLRHLPWPVRLHIVTTGKTWAEAINIGLKQTGGVNDVILMDDDVFINEKTFLPLAESSEIYDAADIFGFKLYFPDGIIQHMGGIVRNGSIRHIGYGEEEKGQFSEPIYVCHATTSLVYIKRHVLDKLGGMATDIPGVQFEDVDFSFRAIKAGLKIMVLPSSATHIQSATKRLAPDFSDRAAEAFYEITQRYFSHQEFVKVLEEYPKPFRLLQVSR